MWIVVDCGGNELPALPASRNSNGDPSFIPAAKNDRQRSRWRE